MCKKSGKFRLKVCKKSGKFCLKDETLLVLERSRQNDVALQSSQSLTHRAPTGTLVRSSQSSEKRERLNECSVSARALRKESD